MDRSPKQKHSIRLPVLPFSVRVFLATAAISLLLYYSIVPAPGSGGISSGPFGIFPYSMWLHFLGYLGLAVALSYATFHLDYSRSQLLIGVFFITVGFGALIELLQYTLPTRTFSLVDILVNTIGAGTGIALWHLTDRVIGFAK